MQEAFGINKTYIYNPVSRKWLVSDTDDLNENRWYPSLAELSDGTMTAISGWDEPPQGGNPAVWNERIDVRNPTTGIWTDFMPTFHETVGPEPIQPHFYPFMFAYFDADEPTKRKLFFAGKSTVAMTGYLWTLASFSLSFSSNGAAEWKPLGGNSFQQGSGAVMMISRTDPIDVGTVYKFGGVSGTSVLATGRKIDLNDVTPLWTAIANMPVGQQRAECNVVAMADGRIALVGGTTSHLSHSNYSTGVNNIIIYNPTTNTYDEISPNFEGTRMYHSSGTFAPTAKIFIAGGEYIAETGSPVVSNYSAQEYYPTYLMSESVRPVITGSPPTVYWNTTIQVTATGPVDHFSLLKLSSTTHANDTTQRYIKVTEASRMGNNYQLKMPRNGGIAPPGHYMLFAVNVEGVPSVARYMHIGPN